MKRKTNKAFITELLILFALLIMVITVITAISIKTRGESLKAKELSEAVICAQNTAEITASARDLSEASEMISQMEGAGDLATEGGAVSFTLTSAEKSVYRVVLEAEPEEGPTGVYVREKISVYEPDDEAAEPLYTLETGNYVKNGEETP